MFLVVLFTILTATEPISIPRIDTRIQIDGKLDEAVWQEAQVRELNFEYLPGDNVTPPVRTEFLVMHNEDTLYLAFRCYDPQPESVRAHLMDRDALTTFVADDHVGVLLDTFNDERRGFQFRVNPLGVQADAVFSQLEGVEDFSWDALWDSRGRITDFGYSVEMAIPFNQLRFPSGGQAQIWGIDAFRSYPRNLRTRIAMAPRDRNNNCLLCQVDKFSGMAGIEPGRNLEITPTITALRTDRRPNPTAPGLAQGDEDIDLGVTLRWSPTPNLSLNAAVNPDFSQVEADAAQLDVNNQFALFFPEKRPFFLEGVDLFTTPIQAVFTRTVADPEMGAKFTGKWGAGSGGLFYTRDRVNNVLLPSNQSTLFEQLPGEVDGTVLRFRRDIGRASSIGALLTDRRGDDYHNTVYGLDASLRIARGDTITLQALSADTENPDQSLASRLFGKSQSGEAYTVDYNHTGQRWLSQLRYRDLDQGFRADSGFVSRVDLRESLGTLTRRFNRPAGSWFTQIDLNARVLYAEDQTGRLSDRDHQLGIFYQGPHQSTASLDLLNKRQYFSGTYFDLEQISIGAGIQPNGSLKLAGNARFGDGIDFLNVRASDLRELGGQIDWKPGRRINLSLRHDYQTLQESGEEIFTANLTQLKVFTHFNLRTYVRAILQYRDVNRNPILNPTGTPTHSENLFSQFLFSYKVNASTVLLIGYADTQVGGDFGLEQQLDLQPQERTFFLKAGYAWTR